MVIVHDGSPELAFEFAGLTPGVVFRVDYELAFAGMGISPVLPAGGRFTNIEHAEVYVADADRRAEILEQRVAAVEGSASWRLTAPLRKLARKLR